MIDPLDIPDFLLRTPELQARIDASWKGRRLGSVSSASFKIDRIEKPTDPGTIALIKEQEAAARAAAKAAKQARKEAAIIRKRQREGKKKP